MLISCDRDGPAGEPSPAPPSSELAGLENEAARSQAALDSLIEVDEPGCSAAVGVEGKVAWHGARGVANLKSGAKITAETVFDIGSVSKQFTATSLLLLVQAGELSLGDRLSRHIQGLPSWAGAVTVDQLIHHTSGIPDYVDLLVQQGYSLTGRTTQTQAIRALSTVTGLSFRPGSRWEYSNSNYLLLGEIVRQVSRQTLPAVLQTRVFGPLDLDMVMDPIAVIPNKAVSYEKYLSKFRIVDSRWEQVGDGAIQTTPGELVRWADNYRTGRLGGQELLRLQLAGAVETKPGDGRYGAGIFSSPDGSLGHDGGWAGFVTTFQISADRRTAVAVSCNIAGDYPGPIATALTSIWR